MDIKNNKNFLKSQKEDKESLSLNF
jgi:hypothetical protein